MVEGFKRNYELRLRSLRELVSDCDPQIGGRAIRIERDLQTSLKNNEINQNQVFIFQNQLDKQMGIFAFECKCKKECTRSEENLIHETGIEADVTENL